MPQAAPGVEQELLAAGFTAEGRYPLLICPPDEVADEPVADASVEVSPVDDEPGLWGVARAMNAAFEAPEATEHDVASRSRHC